MLTAHYLSILARGVSHHTSGSTGGHGHMFDFVLHSFIWSMISRSVGMMIRQYPIIGWITIAVVVGAIVLWLVRRFAPANR